MSRAIGKADCDKCRHKEKRRAKKQDASCDYFELNYVSKNEIQKIGV